MKNKNVLLGQFTGKCCDANAVNNNGMYLSQELFDNLLNSEDYKTAIKNGYYIGFLGHPEDPNDMNFKNACVIMRNMKMESNGDIVGTFDLVDTPVGRVVKSFVDAGVKFGISIRGAGDVANDGTVDPDTFVFRGFDLVTFPAYDDCVPEFRDIAASSDAALQSKYKKVCSTIKNNLQSITSCEAINVIMDQMNPNSEEYDMLLDRCDELNMENEDEIDPELKMQVLEQQVHGMTDQYVEQVRKCSQLENEISQKLSYINDLNDKIEKMESKQSRVADIFEDQAVQASTKIQQLESVNRKMKRTLASTKSKYNKVRSDMDFVSQERDNAVKACTQLKSQVENLKTSKKAITSANLVSTKKMEDSELLLKSKEEEIESLRAQVRETVAANEKLKRDVSNLEADNQKLGSKIEASESILLEYQQNYANQCAYEVGVQLDNVPVNASTTMEDIKSFIYGKASCGYQPVQCSTDTDGTDFEDNGTYQDNSIISL